MMFFGFNNYFVCMICSLPPPPPPGKVEKAGAPGVGSWETQETRSAYSLASN
jgi:hypothetical protein